MTEPVPETQAAQCYGGPEDGREMNVPMNCMELRFPAWQPQTIRSTEEIKPVEMLTHTYLRGVRLGAKVIYVYSGMRP